MRRGIRAMTGPTSRALLGVGVSSVFVVLFLRNTDFGGVADAFTDANVVLILIALAIFFAGIYFRAVRWHYLLRALEPVPPRKLLPIMAIGFGVNNILPLRTGEVVRAHVLHRRHGISRPAGLASVFVARVFDGMMLTAFLCVGVAAGLVGLIDYPGDLFLGVMAFMVFGVSAAFVLLYAIATRPDAAERVVRGLMERIPFMRRRSSGWVTSVAEGFSALRDRRLLLAGVWTSAVAWGLEALMYFLVGEAFGLGLAFPVYLLVAAAANIIIAAPSSAGGVGPFEWATKEVLLIYLLADNAEEVAIAYAASLHGLVLIPIALVGLFFLWLYNVPVGRLARGQEPAQPAAEGQQEPPRPAQPQRAR